MRVSKAHAPAGHKNFLAEIEALGFFRYTDPEVLDQEKRAALQRGWSGLFGENGRLFPADAEELAEGGVLEFLGRVSSFLELQGVRVPLIEESSGVGEDYVLLIDCVRIPIWTNAEHERDLEEPGLLWGLSSSRTVRILNTWLEDASSADRAYGVNAGNDFEVFFLTTALYERIVRHGDASPYYGPYAPNEGYPSFGQPASRP